jgi:hypothetical protein
MARSIVLTVSAVVACNVYNSALLDGARDGGGSPDQTSGTAGSLSGAGGDAAGGVSGTSSSSSGGVQPESGAAGEEPGGGVPGDGSDAGGGTDSSGGSSTGGSTGGAMGGRAGANAGGSGSGAGGASGTGGSGGGAGSGGSGGVVEVLIDDLEDGNHAIALMGQIGYWYVYHDTTAGIQVPEATDTFAPVALTAPIPGNASSTRAVHVTWQGFTGWGAGLGATFDDTATFYDASAQTGVTFWARVDGSSTTRVDVILQELRAISPNCTTCGHHPFRRIDLTTEWQKLYLPFPSFQSDGNGNPSFFDLDPSALYGIQFFTGPNRNVDIWIDDLAFYKTIP